MANDTISSERLLKYLDKTKRALDKIRIVAPKRSYSRKIAQDFLEMATSYFNDAVHFYENENFVDAFACINYSHGWLDCGARLGLFDVGEDDSLFTLAT